jgi:hypothetical protein
MRKMNCIPKVSVAEQLNIKTSEKRALDRLKDIGEEGFSILNEMQAFIAYLEGGTVEEISKQFGMNMDTFKYKLKKIKAHGNTNGSNQEKKITREIGIRIMELKIKEPTLSSMGIATKLYEQDKTEVSHTIVNEYLHDIGLDGYRGSPYRNEVFSPCGE